MNNEKIEAHVEQRCCQCGSIYEFNLNSYEGWLKIRKEGFASIAGKFYCWKCFMGKSR